MAALRVLVLLVAGSSCVAPGRVDGDGGQSTSAPSPQAQVLDPAPRFEAAVVFSDEAAWFSGRARVRGGGYADFGLFGTEDSDVALDLGLLRIDRVHPDLPLRLGVGFGLYGIFLDEPDAEAGALTLRALADYAFSTQVPLRLRLQASMAPDISTFGDGEALIDLSGGLEVEISRWASAELGYRYFELELEDSPDFELHDGVYFGVDST